ncbi:MAG: hypothetical protein AAGJ97_06845 [Planctomycetota bacterium]
MTDPTRPLLTAAFEEALGRCEFVVARRWAAATVRGPRGVGKTTLLEAAAPLLASDGVDVIRFGRDPYEKFGIRLVASVESGRHVAVLADDLDMVPAQVAHALAQIVKGVSRRDDGSPAVTCVATATDPDALPAFFRSGSLPITLGPMTRAECDDYATLRVTRLGLAAVALPVATRDRLFAYSAGTAGTLDRLLDVAIAEKDVRADTLVRPESVDTAAAELGIARERSVPAAAAEPTAVAEAPMPTA